MLRSSLLRNLLRTSPILRRHSHPKRPSISNNNTVSFSEASTIPNIHLCSSLCLHKQISSSAQECFDPLHLRCSYGQHYRIPALASSPSWSRYLSSFAGGDDDGNNETDNMEASKADGEDRNIETENVQASKFDDDDDDDRENDTASVEASKFYDDDDRKSEKASVEACRVGVDDDRNKETEDEEASKVDGDDDRSDERDHVEASKVDGDDNRSHETGNLEASKVDGDDNRSHETGSPEASKVDDDDDRNHVTNDVEASKVDGDEKEEDIEMKDEDEEAPWNADIDVEQQEKQVEEGVDLGEETGEPEGEASLFSAAASLSEIVKGDAYKYFTLKQEDKDTFFGEGLPAGLIREFEATNSASFLIRPQMVHLCKSLQCHLSAFKPRKHYLLDGPVGCGKSIILAMLVMWARSQGWLVFYVPYGKEWTHGGMYAKNERTGLWDTPIQAKSVLEGFLRSHDKLLGQLKCQVLEPLYLGEVPGLPPARGPQHIDLSEGSSLKDLIERGIQQPYISVAVVVRLQKELSLVTEVPVLFAIDQFNSWFTYSEYHQYMGPRKRRPIHARELSMVNAFRKMEEGSPFYVAAFSYSTAVGKLLKHLPGLPRGVRVAVRPFNLKETSSALKYYHLKKLASNPPTEEDIKKLFFLTNGNGSELRTLARLL